jgi:hypothetical protein
MERVCSDFNKVKNLKRGEKMSAIVLQPTESMWADALKNCYKQGMISLTQYAASLRRLHGN